MPHDIRPILHFVIYSIALLLVGSLHATEKIRNGGFEAMPPLSSWSSNQWGGAGTISSTRDGTDPISGSFSARIDIGGTDDPADSEWFFLNFRQVFNVTANRTYAGNYRVRADQPVTMVVQIIEDVSPFRSIAYTEVQLDSGVQELRVVGVADFTGTAHILFNFGKTARGSSIWLDDVSVTERVPGPNNATVTVDFSQSETAADLSGILLGLDISNLNQPGSPLITPLQAKYWRTRPTTAYIDRVTTLGSEAVALLSEGWYPANDPDNRPTPWSDNFVAWKAHCAAIATEHGTSVIYDIWNEPDHPTFFTNWADGTWDNFLATFKAAHDAIRDVVPNAIIAGPSTSADFPWPLLDRFMDYCLTEGLSVQILATHLFGDTDPSFEAMRDDLLKMRTDYIDNPTYAAVGTTHYMATEYGNPLLVARPGSIAAQLRFMEAGLVDGAMRSTWDTLDPGSNTAFDGSLGGLLTSDLSAPRAIWWALKWYADGAGNRVAASSDNEEIVPLAAHDAQEPTAAQVLLGSRAFGGPAQDMSSVQVTLGGLESAGIIAPGATQVTVWIYHAPNASGADPYPTPALLANPTLPVTGGEAVATITGMDAYDAVLLRFSEAETLDFSPPLAIGQWSGDGGDSVLSNAANWVDSTLPTDDTALWNGPGIEPLQLTFNANFGTRADESGTRFRLGSEQSGTLSITNNAGASRDINWLSSTSIDGFHMEAGAGAFTLGASGDPIRLVVGFSGTGLKTTRLQNDSASTATFGANVSWLTGGGRTQNLYFNGGGSGGFTILGPLRVNQSNNESLGYNLGVTVNLTGGGVLTLGGDNASMTGPVTVNNAILALAHDNALGVGTLNLNGPTHNRLQSFDTTPRTIATPVTLSRSAVFGTPGTGDLTFAGSWAGGSLAKTLTVDGIRMDIQQALTGNGARTKDGSGTLVLSGDNSSSSSAFTVAAGTLLIDGTATSGTTTVAANAALGGSGTLPGDLILQNGAGIVFDAGDGLTVNGSTADLGNLSIAALVGLDGTTPEGEYILLDGSAVFNFSAVQNLGGANAVAIAEGKYAFFREGSLRLIVTDAYGAWTDAFELSGADAEPTADPDGDGLSNEEEFILGTEPNNPNSRYAINSQIVDPQVGIPHFTIHFDTVAGRSYRVQRSLDLSPDSWEPIGDGPISGDGNPASVSDPLGEKAFYRVKVILE